MLSVVIALSMFLVAQDEEDPKEAAKKLVNRGNQQFTLEDYPGALEDYKKAYEIYPSPKILMNLAETYRAMDDAVQAVLHYERFLQEAPRDEDVISQVQSRIAELDGRVGRLEITAQDAELTVDGEQVEGTKLVVEPGQHQVTVRSEGYFDFMRTVSVNAGEKVTVDVTMDPMPSPEAPPPAIAEVTTETAEEEGGVAGKWWFWLGAGAAAVAVAGIVVGVALNTGGDDFVPNGELPRSSISDWERF